MEGKYPKGIRVKILNGLSESVDLGNNYNCSVNLNLHSLWWQMADFRSTESIEIKIEMSEWSEGIIAKANE